MSIFRESFFDSTPIAAMGLGSKPIGFPYHGHSENSPLLSSQCRTSPFRRIDGEPSGESFRSVAFTAISRQNNGINRCRQIADNPMPFTPSFLITTRIANCLIRIEAARQAMIHLPINPAVLASLRESARLDSTHYSTMIEGNLLTQEEVSQVIARNEHFPGRERDEKEVLGYYGALEYVERLAAERRRLSETQIKTIHALVMSGGSKRKPVPTPYRDGQNVIRDSRSRAIVYMPPEASDVPSLMGGLVAWVNRSMSEEIPCPIIAGLAHYQFATIHPYFDGNGRTARLLTTLILHLGGYDLKGLYSLEAYYARNLGAYYQALTVGPSHNYYMGRESADWK